MGEVTRLASIHLDGRMLEDKRTLLVDVTFEADRVLRRGRPDLFWTYRSVRVMAIAALDQPFVHAMMERHVELGLLLQVACVAKLRLGLYEQELGFFGMVRRMAGDATNVIS
jgi:hypothetical protein